MTENDNIDNPIEWIEEAISKKHIKYYEYKHLSNITEIGSGAFGKVYRVEWKNTGQYFVLKSFLKYNKSTPREIVRELTFLRDVDFHDNIIRFLGVTSENQCNLNNSLKYYSLVMEYADGGTLRQYLKKNFDTLAWNDKFNIAYQLACAVSCLHGEGILHSDLHPNNILIHQNIVKLTDFGLSQRIEEVTNSHSELFGVIPYVDPEKIIKQHEYKLNEMSDVYSVGVLLWEISSGRPPFYTEGEKYGIGLIYEISEGLREVPIPDTPSDYVSLYKECWNGEPDKRPIMSEVVNRLRNISCAINNTEKVRMVTNNLSNILIDQSKLSSDGLNNLTTNEVKLAIDEILDFITVKLKKENELKKNMNNRTSNISKNYFPSKNRIFNHLANFEVEANDEILKFITVKLKKENELKKNMNNRTSNISKNYFPSKNRIFNHLANFEVEAKTCHIYKTVTVRTNWIEEAIIKGYLKYYDYKQFDCLKIICHGSFKYVYSARYLDNYLALKSFKENSIEKMVHEIKIHQTVGSHDNIIKFYGISRENNGGEMKNYLIVMEYANDGPLQNYLKKNFNNLTWWDKVSLAYQLACAVSCLHHEGIIHRNLESENVLIHQNTVKLTGFFLSKSTDPLSRSDSNTRNIRYVDPKRLSSEPYTLSEKSDIYSVGVLLWEITSGQLPFKGKDKWFLVVNIPNGLRETPIPDTPIGYVDLYTECWNGDPDYRPNISEVVDRLQILKNFNRI
ncbi:kinase-like protein [Rhizophagus irregularis]|uniref:Kinase-like protein n=1 Tax=Rhizophagus irregularis TaxID=588596 RepID=A0A2N1MI23_9GLOM|nr:kinase-like protein [Rhizophagus irregularis]